MLITFNKSDFIHQPRFDFNRTPKALLAINVSLTCDSSFFILVIQNIPWTDFLAVEENIQNKELQNFTILSMF